MRTTWLVVLLAGCYTVPPLRPETATVAPDAPKILVATMRPEENQAAFNLHNDKALDFYQRGKYPEAIAEFEAAFDLRADPLLLFDIAQAYRKAGHNGDAVAYYQKFLGADPQNEQAPKAREYLKQLGGAKAVP